VLLAVGAGFDGFGMFCLSPSLALTIARISYPIKYFTQVSGMVTYISTNEQPHEIHVQSDQLLLLPSLMRYGS